MATEPANVDRIESAADITLNVSKGGERTLDGPDAEEAAVMKVPISTLDRTKDIEISEIRQSSLKANGYSVTSISYSGSMSFAGGRVHGPENEPIRLQDLLFDENDVPNHVSITITHELSGKSETFQDVLVTTDSYEVQSESETETSFDWIAMDKEEAYPEQNN